jgi:hypothetical protein
VYQSLKFFGIIDEKITGMVSLPLRKKDSRISNFYFVSLNGKEDRIIRQGGVINYKAFSVFKKLVIVDTMADYFAYYQQVKENVVPLIQSTWMPADLAAMITHSGTEEIVLINDSQYWPLLKEKLKDVEVKIFEIAFPEGRSVKQLLASNSLNKFIAYMENEKAKIIKSAHSPAAPSGRRAEPEAGRGRIRLEEPQRRPQRRSHT